MVKAAALLVALAVLASPAHGQLQLAVSDCGGAGEASWACDTNDGIALTVVASVTAPPLTKLTGQESLISLGFSEPVPAWWRVGTQSCRAPASLAVSFDGSATSCVDPMGATGSVSGGRFYDAGPILTPAGPLDDHHAYLRVISAVDPPFPPDYAPPAVDSELFLFTVTLDRQRTVGDGACEGCASCVWMILRRLWLLQPVGMGDFVYDDVNSWEQWVSLQGLQVFLHGNICPTTPTSRTTWGQVKSLYR